MNKTWRGFSLVDLVRSEKLHNGAQACSGPSKSNETVVDRDLPYYCATNVSAVRTCIASTPGATV